MRRRSGGAGPTRSSVFICYRREETSGYAGRLYDALQPRFAGRVFMDIDSLAPGSDFVEAIDATLGVCDVMLALIGRTWLEVRDHDGNRRIDDPDDWVRLELATALSRNVRVIPVLLGGASMPAANLLPEDVSGLSRRHAFVLSDEGWRPGVAELIGKLDGTGGSGRAGMGAERRRPSRAFWVRFVVAMVALLVVIGVVVSRIAGGGGDTKVTLASKLQTVQAATLVALVPKDVDSRNCKASAPPVAVAFAQTELVCRTTDLSGSIVVGYLYPDFSSFRNGIAAFNSYVGFQVQGAGGACPVVDPGIRGIIYGPTADPVVECWASKLGPAVTENFLWTVQKSNAVFSLAGGSAATLAELKDWYDRYLAPLEPATGSTTTTQRNPPTGRRYIPPRTLPRPAPTTTSVLQPTTTTVLPPPSEPPPPSTRVTTTTTLGRRRP